MQGIVCFQPLQPFLVDTHVAGSEQGRVHELCLERIERPVVAHDIDELGHEIGADTAIELRGITA